MNKKINQIVLHWQRDLKVVTIHCHNGVSNEEPACPLRCFTLKDLAYDDGHPIFSASFDRDAQICLAGFRQLVDQNGAGLVRGGG